MGLDQSKPIINQCSNDDLAVTVKTLGKNYTDAATAIRENGVDGAFLASLNASELQEAFDDLGIENRLHRRVLERKLAAALVGDNTGTPRTADLSSNDESSSKRRLPRSTTMKSYESTRTHKSTEQRHTKTKKLMELMTVAAEQQMLERFALLNKESELKKPIQIMSSTNQAA